jgi:endonuclease/exonuclease/phosphatase family metal-dependent hydrolase
MQVKIISYNMAMGASRKNKPHLASKDESFTMFVDGFYQEYSKTENAAWFICVQEINRSDNGNKVEELQKRLCDRTKIDWWKHSTTQPRSGTDEAVAIFSNKKLNEVQRYIFDDHRVAVAVKSEISQDKYLWVVNTHLIKPESDSDGKKREKDIIELIQHISTFDGRVPIVLCGDMNIYDCAEGSYSNKAKPHVDPAIFQKTIGKILRFGFTRGEGFSPSAEYATFHSWSNTSDPNDGVWGIIDYIMVNETDRCTAECPRIINFKKKEEAELDASDHRGLLMEVEF